MANDPIPAATLVILRDRPHGSTGMPPEILMVERARTMAFAGGAMVFPGGRIDPGDVALAAAMGAGDDGAARIAAIRETIEEAGVAIGLCPEPTAAQLATIRARLHAGTPFAAALAEAEMTLDLDRLVPFARWLPAQFHMRIFDTRFFLTRCSIDVTASIDATENVRLTWTTAANLLADADAGRATIIYPTRRNLERLALLASYDAAVEQAEIFPPRTITPFVQERDGATYLCIPDDMGYPVTAEPMSTAMRG